MAQATTRAYILTLSTLLIAATCTATAAPPVKEKTITVSEGTNVFVTVSPDHKKLIADLQGLLFAIPFEGGPATQITTPYQEASHPDWSPKGDLIAIRRYTGLAIVAMTVGDLLHSGAVGMHRPDMKGAAGVGLDGD